MFLSQILNSLKAYLTSFMPCIVMFCWKLANKWGIVAALHVSHLQISNVFVNRDYVIYVLMAATACGKDKQKTSRSTLLEGYWCF